MADDCLPGAANAPATCRAAEPVLCSSRPRVVLANVSFPVFCQPMPLRRLLLMVVALVSCAPTVTRSVVLAPNPNGCYVIVYDQAGFSGARQVVNGPARLSTLKLTSTGVDSDWSNRIRSLRVGEAATLTIYTDPSFAGRSMRLPARTTQDQFESAFSGHVQSAVLECGGAER